MVKHLSTSNFEMILFLKRFILFLIPLLIIIGAFVYIDLFRIFWHYDDYYEGTRVGLNRGFVSTMVYINQKDKYHYDSFIFGNSRSRAYYGEEWAKYITNGSSVFHYDTSGGCVAGLYYKVKYIDEHQGYLKNVLIVLDHELLCRTEQKGYLYRIPPVIESYKNLLPFLLDHFVAFTTYKFIYALVDFKMTGEYKGYMGNYISKRKTEWRKDSNDSPWDIDEKEILDGVYYSNDRLKLFENRQHPDSLSTPVIDEVRKDYLRKIAQIFKRHKSSIKIVISPLYDQIRLNSKDLSFLKKTFGENCVYDFSGPNKWNCDYHNYYECSHYRPCVANEILSIIYQ